MLLRVESYNAENDAVSIEVVGGETRFVMRYSPGELEVGPEGTLSPEAWNRVARDADEKAWMLGEPNEPQIKIEQPLRTGLDDPLSHLILTTAYRIDGMKPGSAEVRIHTDRGTTIFDHDQDCCEEVRLLEVIGDPDDLLGTPILRAYETISNASGDRRVHESGTWTFYRFYTIKGNVFLRWLGTSNGYYSERVNIKFYRDNYSERWWANADFVPRG